MRALRYFDSHCHPQLSSYEEDREAVLLRMRERGVGALVVGVDLKTSKEALKLSETHDFLRAAVGLHPNDVPEEAFDTASFGELARNPLTLAIGECGLDYYRQEPSEAVRARQRERLEAHIRLAEEVGKPLMVHCRPTRNSMNAHRDMLEILAEHRGVRAVMHFFTGNAEMASRYLERGCFLSFPGIITFTSEYDEIVRMTPLERILSETDAPFAAPVPHRGKRNEPSYVIETVQRLAQLKEIPLERMKEHIMENVSRTFGFDF
ncbi:MAG: TatD family hydrolase [Patescibacteria group bacterium]|nr:TatD family hydrolase [Patescibacteria group bacterium]